MTTTKNQPVHQLRDGAIKAAIWANQGEQGTFYSVTVSRTYKDGETYRDGHSFSGTELLRAARLLEKAYDHITELRAADRNAEDGAQ